MLLIISTSTKTCTVEAGHDDSAASFFSKRKRRRTEGCSDCEFDCLLYRQVDTAMRDDDIESLSLNA
jgi:hypothetical protein